MDKLLGASVGPIPITFTDEAFKHVDILVLMGYDIAPNPDDYLTRATSYYSK